MTRNRLFPEAAVLLFALTLGAGAAGETARAADASARPAPKKVKMGLFENELISLDELRALQKKKTDLLILDARSRRSYNDGHLPAAEPAYDAEYYRQQELFLKKIRRDPPDAAVSLARRMRRVPHDRPIVTYCNDDCQASAVLLFKLKKLGFTDVRAAGEGFQSWEKKGYPVEKSLT
ncbi:MAG TPA: rhodanese-like domain-containing protein [Candidatus Eisenbacteria bacterium]|nr:rhodanese-like domain-containing protein [Candidatus Eisenbacteria bacterium]